jgi:hypothetical protein
MSENIGIGLVLIMDRVGRFEIVNRKKYDPN